MDHEDTAMGNVSGLGLEIKTPCFLNSWKSIMTWHLTSKEPGKCSLDV